MESVFTLLENNLDLLKYLGLALLFGGLFWVLSVVLSRRLLPAVEKRVDGEKHPIVTYLLQGFTRPAAFFLKMAGIGVALLILCEWVPEPMTAFHQALVAVVVPVTRRALRVLAIITVAWGLVASNGISTLLLRNARHRLDLQIGKSVAHFLAAIYNVVVIALASAILLAEFGYDINGLVAGLGLGGLTIALAAKDSAANFFGGLVLVLEKPFEIGDWIACAGVEGTVEDINLRSTKIRTAPGALTVVPNATLSGSAITNWSGGMEQRKAEILLCLEYGTTQQQIRSYCSSVRTMLETDPEVITDTVLVRFSSLADSGLNITVNFYTTMPGFADHLRIKERVNYSLLDLAAKADVRFAYPARTVYLRQPDTEPPNAPPENP